VRVAQTVRRGAAPPGGRQSEQGVDVDVALLPASARPWRDRVCVVVDQLRASTTITVLLELGCRELLLTRSLAEARRLGRSHDAILVGERRGLLPRGFHCNNSPGEVSQAKVRGRTVVLSTSNGTAVLAGLVSAPALLIGGLLNARACAAAALTQALRHDTGVGIVCAGQRGRFALEDAVAAGWIVRRLQEAAEQQPTRLHLRDGARAAERLAASYDDAGQAMLDSDTAEIMHRIGAQADFAICARIDGSTAVGHVSATQPITISAL
jgi:2-phosphosulfolactate phosphatase